MLPSPVQFCIFCQTIAGESEGSISLGAGFGEIVGTSSGAWLRKEAAAKDSHVKIF